MSEIVKPSKEQLEEMHKCLTDFHEFLKYVTFTNDGNDWECSASMMEVRSKQLLLKIEEYHNWYYGKKIK